MTKAQHHKNIDAMLKDSEKTMYVMIDNAIKSGTLSDTMTDSDNFLLAKAVITIWGDQRNYAPDDRARNDEIRNLSHFI